MAERAQQIGPIGWLGIGAAVSVPMFIGITTAAVVFSSDHLGQLKSADWAALRFTVWQAFLSALLSVGLAIPVARSLSRRKFPGRALLVTLLGAPFLLPVIVAVFGLLAVFGRSGVLNETLSKMDLGPISIFGLHGVVLAHVFFNLPLATRLILQGWHAIPAERFRLAASLNMPQSALFMHLELPMLKRVVPPALLVIFVICTTSFAVALTLGGGPRATTVELAIYQAIRFDFDLGRAAMLAVYQIALASIAAAIALRWSVAPGFGSGMDRQVDRWGNRGRLTLFTDILAITLATLFLVIPICAVVVRGLPNLIDLPHVVWISTARSLLVAMTSTAIVVVAAVCISIAAARLVRLAPWIEGAALLAIAASPLVVGTGLFILVFPFWDPAALALPTTALINALVTLPFALRVLIPAVREAEVDFGRLADSLSISGWDRLRLLILPRARPAIGFSAGLAAALSMGDLGVVALFADPETATLPLQLYRLMGAYRMDEAAGAAVLLLGASFSLFWLFDWGGRRGTSY